MTPMLFLFVFLLLCSIATGQQTTKPSHHKDANPLVRFVYNTKAKLQLLLQKLGGKKQVQDAIKVVTRDAIMGQDAMKVVAQDPAVSVIDVKNLWREGASLAERKAVADEIGRACRDIGFFIITNHGIREQVLEDAWRATKDFFDMPEADKLKFVMPQHEYPFGYSKFGGEVLSAGKAVESVAVANDGTASPSLSSSSASAPDLKELFSLGPADSQAGFPERIFPEVPVQFANAWTVYYDDMAILASKLLGAFALALDLEETFFNKFIDHHASALRALNYPHLEGYVPVSGQLRASAHTDYGTITILRSDAPGLQVSKDKDPPNWQDVPFVKDGLIVNLGDLMKRWTNDKWLSTLHRVVNPSVNDTDWGDTGTTRRQSMAFFHNPNRDALISHLGSDHSKYEPIVAGDFLMAKHLAATAGQ